MFLFLNYGTNEKKRMHLFLNYGTNKEKRMYSFLNYRCFNIAIQDNVFNGTCTNKGKLLSYIL
jgi:hypothetical protein